jgi:hypothetical protein
MKDANTGKTSKTKAPRSTDWGRLRHMSDAEIRKGIAPDPDVHATDERFWKHAKVVWPVPKQIVTMRLDADLPMVPSATWVSNPHQCHSAALYGGQ